jgi:hypothetical protein
MIKLLDGVRLTNTNNEARGIRNGTYARLAETYLFWPKLMDERVM